MGADMIREFGGYMVYALFFCAVLRVVATIIMEIGLFGSDYEGFRTAFPGYIRRKYRELPQLQGTRRVVWVPRLEAASELGIVLCLLTIGAIVLRNYLR